MVFLNSNAVVTPVYYCGFTTLTIVANVILFQGIKNAQTKDIIGVLIGFIISFIGVYVINDQNTKKPQDYDEIELKGLQNANEEDENE